MAKTSEENMSYVIFKTDEAGKDESDFQYEVTTEFEILEALVQKHHVDRYGISNEIQNRKWNAIHKEFTSLTNTFPSIEDLKTIWKDAKTQNRLQVSSVKSLEDSLSHTLGNLSFLCQNEMVRSKTERNHLNFANFSLLFKMKL